MWRRAKILTAGGTIRSEKKTKMLGNKGGDRTSAIKIEKTEKEELGQGK